MSQDQGIKKQRCAMDSFSIIDLRSQEKDLLDQVYKELLQSHFPIADELDDLDVFRENLSKAADGQSPGLHLLVCKDGQRPVAVCAYEFYPEDNFVLMSYICVCADYRRCGLAKSLIDKVEQQMRERTGGKSVNAFYAETHPVHVTDGVMDAAQRQVVLRSLGFRCLKFKYIQPPLSEKHAPCDGLVLLVKDKLELPSSAVIAYLDGFARSTFDYDWKSQQFYMSQLAELSAKTFVETTDELPW